MGKIAWVALPLGAYALYVGLNTWRRGAPSRHALNVQTSVLLMLYLLTTAGLGVFWVANQQLPVFDLHYLFGYATVLLVAVHLSFNLPVVGRYLKKAGGRSKRAGVSQRVSDKTLWRYVLVGIAMAGSFVLGMRHGRSELSVRWDAASSEGARAGSIEAIVAYHEHSSSSRTGVFSRAPSVDWGARPPPFKDYPQSETVPLVDAAKAGLANRPLVEALRTISEGTRLDAARLGAILFAGAGVTRRRGDLALRASPSSGALFSSELYALVWDVAGLAPGVYHYDPNGHRLHVLSTGAPSRIATGLGDVPAAIVATSIFRRTGFKYAERAYRYAVADTGHLLENLRIAAAEGGVSAEPESRFDESLVAAEVGVDGIEEGVLAVLPLRRRPAAASPVSGGFDIPRAPKDTAIGITGLVHVATSLRSRPTPDELIALPAPVAVDGEALAVISSRRSQRRFTDAAITLEQLGSLLGDAAQRPRLSTALRPHVLVDRVDGLAPGVYRYHPEAHALSLSRSGEVSGEARSAALEQDVVGDAAAVLVLSAHRQAMFSEGARGYRHVFLEAGMFSERYLLSAVARGLGACPVGAFYDDDASKLIGVSPHEEWVIHFIALGVLR